MFYCSRASFFAHCLWATVAASVGPHPMTQASPDWPQDSSFYLLFVRSFADSTQGPLANDGVGDLRGIIERLDYLNDGDPTTETDLGVTGIWLLPINQSPSYHGYDTTDYYAIDDEYGTLDDFEELLAACETRGIKVIKDLVINHSSNQHPWFIESTDPTSDKRDWYVWSDDDPGYEGPWGQDVWHENPTDDRHDTPGYYYGAFWHGMPDLNQTNPAVTKEFYNIAEYWLDLGVDGFRLDAVKHLIEDGPIQENTPETVEWLREFSDHLQSHNPEAWIVAEVWSGPDAIAQYLTDERATSALPSAFDFPLAYAIVEGLRDGNAGRIRADLQRAYDMFGLRASPFLTNHDQDRPVTAWNNDRSRAKAAATLLLTAPGTPFIFYGEEIGQFGGGPHEALRTPLQWTNDPKTAGFTNATPWNDPKPDVAAISIEAQSGDDQSLLSHYRRLLDARESSVSLRRGDLTVIETNQDGVVAYVRSAHNSPRILTIVNATNAVIGDLRIDASTLGLDGSTEMTDLLEGDRVGRVLPKHPELWKPIDRVLPYDSRVIRID